MQPNPRIQLYILAAHTFVAVLALICVTLLSILGDLDPQATVALFGTAVGLVGGSASSIAATIATNSGNGHSSGKAGGGHG